MFKVEAIENFTLEKYSEIKDSLISRSIKRDNWLYKGDIFECNKELADYLLGANHLGKAVVKIIEIIPEVNIKIDSDALVKEIIKQTKKKKTTKK